MSAIDLRKSSLLNDVTVVGPTLLAVYKKQMFYLNYYNTFNATNC